jgi:acyl-CoA reductase-like NAD-dependent aldehyde dehydrogenase
MALDSHAHNGNGAHTHGHVHIDATEPEGVMREMLQRMREAQRADVFPSYESRVGDLDRLERAILRRKDEIVDAIVRDFGHRARAEIQLSEIFLTVEEIRYARENLKGWMTRRDAAVGWLFRPARAELVPQPLGVIGVISPWNYPLSLALIPLVNALAAGNRVMIKPSEYTPASGELLRSLLADAFEPDHVGVVLGDATVGAAFAGLAFDHLVFTGSTQVGRHVMRAAAENLVPVTLELGGKSPAIVGRDVSLATAAERIASGKLFNSGQTCIAPDYVLVPIEKRETFIDELRKAVARMAPSIADNPDYTCVVNDRHYRRLVGYLDEARAKGARVIEVNPRGETLDAAQRKLPLTLVVEPDDALRVMQDEIFGPILPIKAYTSIEEAFAFINDRPRPLALYYFSDDKDETERVLHETIAGGVTVNDAMLHVGQPGLPFGGVGASGMGAYHGRWGFDTFTRMKPVFHQAKVNGGALIRPPYGRVLDAALKVLLRER